ncbi:hypothetical protein JQK15_20430 [Sphingobium sp. BHU LFT2]|uniref:hypothetical protein n=1 Tax=Sphingobium sp. BHU LFT2 TaxID=2807634 RepID=UPI001BE9CD1A|nr:hypothetical protein [Sphingobium sp. BHU LFT2]MBT2245882.1 hypothetical protein [Sphingobium sp. BHU LFT2]
MKILLVTLAFAAASLTTMAANAQGVNYHSAQQAGKVWGDKMEVDTRDRKPATTAELNAARVRHAAEYNRLLESVGRKNAERWLGMQAQQDRRERTAARR